MPPATPPKWVPVLHASDIHKGDSYGPRRTHCSATWREEILPISSPQLPLVFRPGMGDIRRRWTEAYIAAARHLHPRLASEVSIVALNDDHLTKDEAARCCNVAFAAVGYTEGQSRRTLQLARALNLLKE